MTVTFRGDFTTWRTAFPGRPTGLGRPRRGATIILVLGLLAVTLAVSYAMMRTQVTSLQIQTNLDRRDDARQAALTGMATALGRIHQADWKGVNSTVSGVLEDGVSYEVKFATGDPALTADDPDYAEYPFRLTLTSTGYSEDPANPGLRAEYKVQSVVQLVRRARSATPSGWNAIHNFTVVQWADRDTELQFPARVEGPVVLGGRLKFAEEYPLDSQSRKRYLGDLNKMRQAGLGDYRPFNGPVYLPYDRTSSTTRSLLTNELGLTTVNIARGGSAPLAHPGAPTSYRLYPGGQEYPIPVIQTKYGQTLSNVTLAPDPLENPLGLFCSQGLLTADDLTTIHGTVITDGSEPDILLAGQNVRWKPVALPPLHTQAADDHVFLPAALVKDDFHVRSAANVEFDGFLAVWDKMEVEKGDPQTTFKFTGRALVHELQIHGRDTWNLITELGSVFFALENNLELLGLANPDPYFPVWLEKNHGFTVAPKITMTPSASTTRYHWQDWSQPVYVPFPGNANEEADEGLIWDLVRWTEAP